MRTPLFAVLAFAFLEYLGGTPPVAAQEGSQRETKKPRFTVSRETTWAHGPLRADGSVDFAAAVNRKLSQGVTPENNACVLLYQALGPAPEGARMPPGFFEHLGVAPPPIDGKYLTTLGDTLPEEKKTEGLWERLDEQLFTAMSRPWSRMEFPDLARWVDENEEQLRLVHAAVRREKYFSPLIVDEEGLDSPAPLIAALLPGVSSLRSLGRLLCVRSMLYIGERKDKKAWNDLLACHRLGRHIAMGSTVIEALVGYAIEEMSHEATLAFIRETQPTAAQAKKYRDDLQAMPPIASIRDKVNVAERCIYLDALMVMAWKRPEAMELLGVEDGLAAMARIIDVLGLAAIDWDLALRSGNGWYDRMVAALNLPTYAERKAALEKLDRELNDVGGILKADAAADLKSKAKRDAFIARKIGDVVAAVLLPGLIPAQAAEERLRQRSHNLEVALALAGFHADRGRYPEKLGQLTPRYLAKIPVDHFSGKSLIYNPTDAGYLLYSVGKNMKDDAGQTFEDEPAGDDLAVRVAARE